MRDRPGLHHLLLSLDGLHDAAWWDQQVPDLEAPAQTVLAELITAGAVVDASAWRRERSVAEARFLATTGRHPESLARRERLRVSLQHDGGTGDLAALARAVLLDAGVTPTEDLDADLTVVMCTGEPSRAAVEEIVRSRVRHLLVRVEGSRAQIGPLVTPGVTPCLTCHDLHRTVWDPGWGALVPQFGRRATAHNPPALGAVLPLLVVGDIAEIVLAVADDPSIFPALDVTCLGPGTADRRTWSAGFHHRCSCALLPAAR